MADQPLDDVTAGMSDKNCHPANTLHELVPPATQPPWPDPIPGILPFGTVTVFAGASGVGKTTMLAEWIQRWRTGRTICGQPTNPATNYYYVAADRQWSSHQQWFDAIGFPEIQHYSLADDHQFDLSELLKPFNAPALFVRVLDQIQPIPGSHVFVDPVSPVFIGGSSNDPRVVARSLLGFSKICASYEINITVTAHFAKQKADSKDHYQRPQDRIAGSHAWSGFSDTQIYMVDPLPPAQPWTILGWVPRHARPQDFPFVRDAKSGLFIPYDVIREDELAAHVLDCMVESGITSLSVIVDRCQAQHGYTRAQVKRALDRLITEGRVIKAGRGKFGRVKIH